MKQLFLLCLTVCVIAACRKDPLPLEQRFEKVILPPAGYKLVWSDEFDGEVLDTSKWSYRALGNRREGVNTREAIQIDTRNGWMTINSFVRNDTVFTGMIGTMNKFEAKYGYYECRAKVEHITRGYWPAFWLQSRNYGKTLNPEIDGMEIDVFEFYIGNPRITENAVHWDGYDINHKFLENKVTHPERIDGDIFHHYALEWTPDSLRFFFNGYLVWAVSEPVSQVEQYLILSTEVDNASLFKASLPTGTKFTVDYVRVYQKNEIIDEAIE